MIWYHIDAVGKQSAKMMEATAATMTPPPNPPNPANESNSPNPSSSPFQLVRHPVRPVSRRTMVSSLLLALLSLPTISGEAPPQVPATPTLHDLHDSPFPYGGSIPRSNNRYTRSYGIESLSSPESSYSNDDSLIEDGAPQSSQPSQSSHSEDHDHDGHSASSPSTSTSSTSTSSSLSSSSSTSDSSDYNLQHPPWNPSPSISRSGFLTKFYPRLPGEWEELAQIRGRYGHRAKRTNRTNKVNRVNQASASRTSGKHFKINKLSKCDELLIPVRIRQVPGDGNCLFHSLVVCLHHAVNGTHIPMDSPSDLRDLRVRSWRLRNLAVDVLEGVKNGHNGINGGNGINGINGGQNSVAGGHGTSSAGVAGGSQGATGAKGATRAAGALAGGLAGGLAGVAGALGGGPKRKLFLQGEEYLPANELLTAAAAQFDLDGGEYCRLMRQESYWGGGPEIVALCNYLQRPIHIYELIPTPKSSSKHPSSQHPSHYPSTILSTLPPNHPLTTKLSSKLSSNFTLRRMAIFGSPKFDRKSPLHILSADSRFPDVDPKRVRSVGNHFLALFPLSLEELNELMDEGKSGNTVRKERRELKKVKKMALLRGGYNKEKHGERKSTRTKSRVRGQGRDDGQNEREEREERDERHIDMALEDHHRWDGGLGTWDLP